MTMSNPTHLTDKEIAEIHGCAEYGDEVHGGTCLLPSSEVKRLLVEIAALRQRVAELERKNTEGKEEFEKRYLNHLADRDYLKAKLVAADEKLLSWGKAQSVEQARAEKAEAAVVEMREALGKASMKFHCAAKVGKPIGYEDCLEWSAKMDLARQSTCGQSIAARLKIYEEALKRLSLLGGTTSKGNVIAQEALDATSAPRDGKKGEGL